MAAVAHRHLAEFKGRAISIPNPSILIETLTLQEARASCDVENIVTTQDSLFRASLFPESVASPAAKEAAHYGHALRLGFRGMREREGRLTCDLLISIYRATKSRTDGFRVHPGTVIQNRGTGETLHVPPQDPAEILSLMRELESFVNDDSVCALDPLVKMAIIHHQFESIHPFSDGNGRVGRILNVLYLVRCGLLDTPILYLSRAIARSKGEYYRHLQAVRDTGQWADWLLYMLTAIAETAQHALRLVERIRWQMADTKHSMRERLPRIYSQELLNNLFRYPYTRIDCLQRDLGVTRQTAARYLERLTSEGFVSKVPAGRTRFYVNEPLARLFLEADGE